MIGRVTAVVVAAAGGMREAGPGGTAAARE